MFRNNPQRPSHGKYALFSILAFASVSLRGGAGPVTKQADWVQKGSGHPSGRGRCQTARSRYENTGSGWPARGQGAQSGSEDPAVACHPLKAFHLQALKLPTKTRSAHPMLSLLFLILPSTGECFPVLLDRQREEMQFQNLLTSPAFKFLIS